MTIDPETFRDEWAVLEEKFDENYSREYANRYYTYLDRRVSTEEFLQAARWYFVHPRGEHGNRFPSFPSPDELLARALDYRRQVEFAERRDAILEENERKVRRLTRQARKALPPGKDPQEAFVDATKTDIIGRIDRE